MQMQITIWDVFFKNILLLPEIRNDATNISITEKKVFQMLQILFMSYLFNICQIKYAL